MKNRLIHKSLSIRQSAIHGYGVFADEDIASQEIIEECPGIFTRGEDPGLRNYYFLGTTEFGYLIPTGFGMLYNHADLPNAVFFLDQKYNVVTYKAIKPIAKDEEVVISYGPDWFSSRKLPVKQVSFMYKAVRFFMGMPIRALVIIVGLYGLIRFLQHLTIK